MGSLVQTFRPIHAGSCKRGPAQILSLHVCPVPVQSTEHCARWTSGMTQRGISCVLMSSAVSILGQGARMSPATRLGLGSVSVLL